MKKGKFKTSKKKIKIFNLNFYRLKKQLKAQGLEFLDDHQGNIKLIRRSKKIQ